MKKIIAAVTAAGLLLSGCADSRTINGKVYEPYGVVNANNYKSDDICYEIPFMNFVVGIILIETVFVPLYVVGWDLYEPVRVKSPERGCKA